MSSIHKEFFSFFDQFRDVQIDLTEYLLRFSSVENSINFSNLQPVVVTVKNIFEQVALADDYKKNNNIAFEYYEIIDGEKIETVAYNVYDAIDFWWVIAMFNGLTNLFHHWPKTNSQLILHARKLVEIENLYPYPTYYKILFNRNEDYRNISLLKKGYLSDFIWQLRKTVIEKHNAVGITI